MNCQAELRPYAWIRVRQPQPGNMLMPCLEEDECKRLPFFMLLHSRVGSVRCFPNNWGFEITIFSLIFPLSGSTFNSAYFLLVRRALPMNDIIELLGTICWPLKQIYTWDKSITSNLLILLFFWPFLFTNDCLWWPMGWLYGVLRVRGTMGKILKFLGTIRWPKQHRMGA